MKFAFVALAVLGTTALFPLAFALPTGNTITIQSDVYVLPVTVVAAGSTVIVANDDLLTHTVTSGALSADGAFNVILPGTTSATFVAPAAGEYAYHCTYHPWMRGVLVVE